MSIKSKIGRQVNRVTRKLARIGHPVTRNDRHLAELEGKYEGQKAVIIGTGPSLRINDLERLHGWQTFACNKIYLAFDQTDWRPDFYSICDIKIAEHCNEIDFNRYFQKTTVINAIGTKNSLKADTPVLHYRYSSYFSIGDWNHGEDIKFPRSFGSGIFGGYSVMVEQLQMAYLMGFTKVAVIGADLSYFGGKKTGETSPSGDLVSYDGNEVERNYFHKNYYRPGDVTTVPQVEKMRNAWEYCRILYETSGRTLVNASRQSALERVSRVPFDDLFPPETTDSALK